MLDGSNSHNLYGEEPEHKVQTKSRDVLATPAKDERNPKGAEHRANASARGPDHRTALASMLKVRCMRLAVATLPNTVGRRKRQITNKLSCDFAICWCLDIHPKGIILSTTCTSAEKRIIRTMPRPVESRPFGPCDKFRPLFLFQMHSQVDPGSHVQCELSCWLLLLVLSNNVASSTFVQSQSTAVHCSLGSRAISLEIPNRRRATPLHCTNAGPLCFSSQNKHWFI